MIHLGDITKIRGDEIPPVDCITGGSPCQDLSVAGKRAGLEGERSGLFMEQIRIVKEMRERDRRTGRTAWAVRPRFMVWENVPGAFSSNGGKDFQAVLTEIVKIAEPDAPDVPLPDKGKWPKAGCLYSDVGNWSVAWRVHDAQFWGVPQRRKRIALVADFGGLAAPEVCFVRAGLSRDPESRGAEGQGTAAAAQGGAGTTGQCLNSWDVQSKHIQTPDGVAESLYAGECRHGGGESYVMDAQPILLESNQNNATVQTNGVSTSLPASMGMGGGYVPMVTGGAISFQERAGKPGGGKGILIQPERTGALSTLNNQSVLATVYGIDQQGGKGGANFQEDVCPPILSDSHGTPHAVAYGISAYESNAMKSGNPHSGVYEADTSRTLDLNGGSPACNQGGVAIVQAYCLQGNGIDRSDTAGCNGRGWREDQSYTRNTIDRPAVCAGFKHKASGTAGGIGYEEEKAPSLICGQESAVYDAREQLCVEMTSTKNTIVEEGISPTLTKEREVVATFQNTGRGWWNESDVAATLRTPCGGDSTKANLCRIASVVRRLTPTECERLQGFPDGWTDIGEWVDSKGKKHKAADSPRYKALGNSIALPFWFYLLRRISAQYERPATLGSLFDGIGGFPLCWERCNGKGTAIWASEIEEFPIAVTKKHFPEEKEDT